MKYVTLESSTDVLSKTRCRHTSLKVKAQILDNSNLHKDIQLCHFLDVLMAQTIRCNLDIAIKYHL